MMAARRVTKTSAHLEWNPGQSDRGWIVAPTVRDKEETHG